MNMIASSSLEAIIAAVNSTHLRTQPRVTSAVAPENASGVNTAATMISNLRIISAAQITITASRITNARLSSTAGFCAAAPSCCSTISFPPSAAMFEPVV